MFFGQMFFGHLLFSIPPFYWQSLVQFRPLYANLQAVSFIIIIYIIKQSVISLLHLKTTTIKNQYHSKFKNHINHNHLFAYLFVILSFYFLLKKSPFIIVKRVCCLRSRLILHLSYDKEKLMGKSFECKHWNN